MKKALVFLAFSMFCMTQKAEAAFLFGTVEYDYVNANLDVPDAPFTGATTITSTSQTVGSNSGTTSTGDFTAIVGDPPALNATIVGLTYNPPTLPVGYFATFVSGLYTYHFTITSFSNALLVDDALTIINGLGYWTTDNPAYETTSGGFTLSATRSTVGGVTSYNAGGTLEAFQEPVVSSVPEPASLLLFGTGLLGLGAVARRRVLKRRA